VDPDSRRLAVSVTDGRGRPVRAPGLAAWLSSVAPARLRGSVAIALVGDARSRALNHRYRGQDRPTDVLSFPTDPGGDPDIAVAAADGPHLGDIVIATGVARRQAAAARHAYGTELRVLALHGLLHLIGYDHHAPDDRGRMARLERRLRRQGGLREGLIERARPSAAPRPGRRE
jgi:probable rRNA maturation factor